MIIIIDRKLSDNEVRQVKKLAEQNAECLSFGDFFNDAEKINIPNEFNEQKLSEFLNIILEFPHKNFDKNKFNDIYKYNNIKLFYYHKFRIFHSLKESFVFSEFIKDKFSSNNEFYIFSDKSNLLDFFDDNYNIKIFNSTTRINKNDKYFTLLKYSLFVFIRYFLSLFRNYNLKQVKHLIIENTKPIKLLDKNLNKKHNNVVFSYLYDKLDKKSLIFNVIDIPKNYTDLKFNKYLFSSPRKNVKTFFYERAFINNFSFKKYKEIKNKLLSISNTLFKIKKTKEIKPHEKAIINALISLNKTTVFYLIRYESIKSFFKKYNFKTFTATDENGALTKGIVDAAKDAKLTTFGTQHGGMGKYTLSYILSKKDNYDYVIPDFTFVWGEYWKKFLTDTGNYSSEKLKIVGQPRTDIIPIIKSKIKEQSKTVLYASQPMPNLDYKKRAAIDVLKLAKENPSLNVIIKLHPFEYDGIEYYNNLANEMNVQNYKISTDDLYLLIAKSQIVITCFSTVGAEAAYFNKPLIIIDYNNEDLLKYIESKIAFGAYNFNDLNKLVNNIIEKKISLDVSDINNFINNFAYKIDGKVSDRMLNTIYNAK